MFLATLYFALPLLGKSRPLLAFLTQSLSKRVPCSGHSRIAPWVPWIWVEEVSLGCEEVQAFLRLGSGGSAALCGWFYFAVLIITQPDGHLMGSRPSPRGVGPLGSREELAKALRQVECGRKNAGVGREQTWNAKVFWECLGAPAGQTVPLACLSPSSRRCQALYHAFSRGPLGCCGLSGPETAAPGARGGGAVSVSGPLLLWGAGASQDPQQIRQSGQWKLLLPSMAGQGGSMMAAVPGVGKYGLPEEG